MKQTTNTRIAARELYHGRDVLYERGRIRLLLQAAEAPDSLSDCRSHVRDQVDKIKARTEARTELVSVRLTPGERAELEDGANEAGLTLADYVRKHLGMP